MSAPTEGSNVSTAENVGEPPIAPKVVEVEPVPVGVAIKTKRVLTEAQKAALARGREKLAEKRRLAKEAEDEESDSTSSSSSSSEDSTETSDEAKDSNTYESSQQDSWCSIM